tara:strand:+ start:6502 stop:7200 length:699 start_codon:yes stop_codon:yes gene_type:complete
MLYLFILFSVANAYYLSQIQKTYVKNILQDKTIDDSIKEKTKRILVSKYSWWAINQAKSFQRKYKIKSNYVRSSELIGSSLHGLVKSMKKYDGSVEVPYYSCFYIKKELFRCLTQRQPFGRFTHYEMMHLKLKPMENTRVEAMSDNRLYVEETKHFHYNKENEIEEYLNEILGVLDPMDKRIFLYRFDIHTLEKRYPLRKIALLMGLSYESIKISLNRSRNIIKSQIIIQKQ